LFCLFRLYFFQVIFTVVRHVYVRKEWRLSVQTRAPPTGAGWSTFSYPILNCKQFIKLYTLLIMMVI
jgi:hypothetical protein